MSDPTPPKPCRAVGYVVTDGRKVALVRCDRPAGHDEPRALVVGETLSELTVRESKVRPDDVVLKRLPGEPHAVTFEWVDGETLLADWPEAYDPDEPVDVDVPELSDEHREAAERELDVDRAIDAHREARAFGDD